MNVEGSMLKTVLKRVTKEKPHRPIMCLLELCDAVGYYKVIQCLPGKQVGFGAGA